MSSYLVSGDDGPPPDALGVIWVAIAGWTMGTTALSSILVDGPFTPSGLLGLLASGLPTGLLSAGAALAGMRGKTIRRTVLATMASSFMTSLLCPMLTWIALIITGSSAGMGHAGLGDSALGVALIISVFGAFFAVPLGLAFGAVYAIALSTLKRLQGRVRSRSDMDLALVILGSGLACVGAICLGYVIFYPSTSPFLTPPAAGVNHRAVLLPALTTCVGFAAAGFGVARILARKWFVARAARGASAGWAVVSASEIDDPEALPRVFPFGRPEAVLIRRTSTAGGPFRSGEASTAVARV